MEPYNLVPQLNALPGSCTHTW